MKEKWLLFSNGHLLLSFLLCTPFAAHREILMKREKKAMQFGIV